MSTGIWNVKPSNVRKAVDAVRQAGIKIASVIIRRDGIEVVAAKPGDANGPNGKTENEWDEVLSGEEASQIR